MIIIACFVELNQEVFFDVLMVQRHNLFRSGPIPVEHFTLFSSQLGKEQSVYTPEVEYALA